MPHTENMTTSQARWQAQCLLQKHREEHRPQGKSRRHLHTGILHRRRKHTTEAKASDFSQFLLIQTMFSWLMRMVCCLAELSGRFEWMAITHHLYRNHHNSLQHLLLTVKSIFRLLASADSDLLWWEEVTCHLCTYLKCHRASTPTPMSPCVTQTVASPAWHWYVSSSTFHLTEG